MLDSTSVPILVPEGQRQLHSAQGALIWIGFYGLGLGHKICMRTYQKYRAAGLQTVRIGDTDFFSVDLWYEWVRQRQEEALAATTRPASTTNKRKRGRPPKTALFAGK